MRAVCLTCALVLTCAHGSCARARAPRTVERYACVRVHSDTRTHALAAEVEALAGSYEAYDRRGLLLLRIDRSGAFSLALDALMLIDDLEPLSSGRIEWFSAGRGAIRESWQGGAPRAREIEAHDGVLLWPADEDGLHHELYKQDQGP